MTVAPLSLTARVEMWAMDLVDALEADYKRRYPNSFHDKKLEVRATKNRRQSNNAHIKLEIRR